MKNFVAALLGVFAIYSLIGCYAPNNIVVKDDIQNIAKLGKKAGASSHFDVSKEELDSVIKNNYALQAYFYENCLEDSRYPLQRALRINDQKGASITLVYLECYVHSYDGMIDWVRNPAKSGNVLAQTFLGFMYESGKGISKDDIKAKTWYRKAAERGYAPAQMALASLYVGDYNNAIRANQNQNYLYQSDADQAIAWYRKVAEQGYVFAQMVLGNVYSYEGYGVAEDEIQAVAWYKKAAIQGYTPAIKRLESLYNNGLVIPHFKNKDIIDDETTISESGKADDMQARLNVMQAETTSILKNYQAMEKYFAKNCTAAEGISLAALVTNAENKPATDVGRSFTQLLLECYVYGKGGIATWLQKIAEQENNAVAQTFLASIYVEGMGTLNKDNAQAEKWYRKAAEQGYVLAQTDLGTLYMEEKDNVQAVKWFRKAAEQGYAPAQTWLGKMYAEGKGLAKDEAQAVAWHRKAAEQGYAFAQMNLGWMYLEGKGVAKDEDQGTKWFMKGKEQLGCVVDKCL
ncbi:putative Beta-lactamase [Crenothrix polyspora]|uniref:Putative Beta-lactamase n=1 Tax=Crenothrix polyspora TaxID=360316 RepID=A0A1R4H0K2_9GAMM|nr:tetratricopeptide repeat protein [Crenothrix polyspora]SJM89369.1 putative Beta-lactamase [Crenothrix polyspora]